MLCLMTFEKKNIYTVDTQQIHEKKHNTISPYKKDDSTVRPRQPVL